MVTPGLAASNSVLAASSSPLNGPGAMIVRVPSSAGSVATVVVSAWVVLGASVAAGGFDALIERERSLTVFADGEQVIDALRRLAVGSPVVRVAYPMGRGAHDMWALITSLSFDVLSSTPEPVRMVQVGLLPTVEPA